MELTLKVSIHHWRYEDGLPIDYGDVPPPLFGPDPVPAGWYCWCYPSNYNKFEEWMELHCPTADVTFRFNSGDPMYTVCIFSKEESMLFCLAWS